MNREEQVLKKSFYALLFSIVLALVTLAGCGRSSSAAAGGSGTVTLESAAEQPDSQSGKTQESSGADGQTSDLQSAPDQVNGSTNGNNSSAQNEPESTVNDPKTADDKPTAVNESHTQTSEPEAAIDENGTYTTKKEAKKLGWEGGSLEKYAKGKCIGGDHFGNYEGILPSGNYHECDIDTLGRKSRGAKRIIYSDDGRIYYTEDHYETFELLYGEE